MVRKKHLLNKIEFLQEHIGKLSEELTSVKKELDATKDVIKEMSEKVTFVFNNCNPNSAKQAVELLNEWLNGDKKGSDK